ncbi:RNA polymerase sigma factor, sigma-70 family [Echinicola vietnamensis DSM 17526]|uniref:RNA polymerase sigma factor, sigma-70 family n=2 Tax=Echinicola TaxID=390846 RepID=L0FYY2_ECHVK|nr:RNA polymerase sigma factor, sigma-70 family [Echinicola vietnamensis DSM 17526]
MSSPQPFIFKRPLAVKKHRHSLIIEKTFFMEKNLIIYICKETLTILAWRISYPPQFAVKPTYHPMERFRPLLFTYAYNILGAAMEAEDVVQDVFEKFLTLDTNTIQNEKAYLIRMVINQAINRKKQLNRSLLHYPNDWLPEPVITNMDTERLEDEHILSYSMMLLLEQLEPGPRAVFLLKESFGYSHKAISQTLDISQETSRQQLSRAKKKLRNTTSPQVIEPNREGVEAYLKAIKNADAKALEELLLEDISLTSDGGGKVPAGTKLVQGTHRVVAMLQGLFRKFYQEINLLPTTVNHSPAILYLTPAGEVTNCQVFVFENRKIARIFFIRNPEKLLFLQKRLHQLSQKS